jgi:hypothetical protein
MSLPGQNIDPSPLLSALKKPVSADRQHRSSQLLVHGKHELRAHRLASNLAHQNIFHMHHLTQGLRYSSFCHLAANSPAAVTRRTALKS